MEKGSCLLPIMFSEKNLTQLQIERSMEKALLLCTNSNPLGNPFFLSKSQNHWNNFEKGTKQILTKNTV